MKTSVLAGIAAIAIASGSANAVQIEGLDSDVPGIFSDIASQKIVAEIRKIASIPEASAPVTPTTPAAAKIMTWSMGDLSKSASLSNPVLPDAIVANGPTVYDALAASFKKGQKPDVAKDVLGWKEGKYYEAANKNTPIQAALLLSKNFAPKQPEDIMAAPMPKYIPQIVFPEAIDFLASHSSIAVASYSTIEEVYNNLPIAKFKGKSLRYRIYPKWVGYLPEEARMIVDLRKYGDSLICRTKLDPKTFDLNKYCQEHWSGAQMESCLNPAYYVFLKDITPPEIER